MIEESLETTQADEPSLLDETFDFSEEDLIFSEKHEEHSDENEAIIENNEQQVPSSNAKEVPENKEIDPFFIMDIDRTEKKSEIEIAKAFFRKYMDKLPESQQAKPLSKRDKLTKETYKTKIKQKLSSKPCFSPLKNEHQKKANYTLKKESNIPQKKDRKPFKQSTQRKSLLNIKNCITSTTNENKVFLPNDFFNQSKKNTHQSLIESPIFTKKKQQEFKEEALYKYHRTSLKTVQKNQPATNFVKQEEFEDLFKEHTQKKQRFLLNTTTEINKKHENSMKMDNFNYKKGSKWSL